jgi:hypothetical protein
MNKLDALEILNAGRNKNALFRASKKTKRATERRESKPHPVAQNATRMGHPVVSVLDALQAFFSAAVVVEEREGSVVFLGGGAMVALPFE